MQRADAQALDAVDPLAPFRSQFDVPDDGPIYMDGNSLGRPPVGVRAALVAGVTEWRSRLVEGWESWIDLPGSVGDRLGRILGAGAGQVLVCDSTTINLYKLAAAAIGARPGRPLIVGPATDFPTDRYVLQSLAASLGRELRLVDIDAAETEDRLESAIDSDVALVCLSHVDFRTGRRIDAGRITDRAHDAGALILWDLAHSAGSVPVDLDGWGADLAVGCTYKYLNAGPGAPAFLYVRGDLQDEIRQPIWGWFGQADQFSMGEQYTPAPGITSFLTGTPGILGLRAVEAALEVTERAGIQNLWAKSEGLTALLAERVEERLAPLGARSVTPADPSRRGAHLAVGHPAAWAWCRTLIDRGLMVGDFRPPDVIRLGPAPLYTRYVECFDAVERMAEVLEQGLDPSPPVRRVT
jgi:kynureninase